MNFYVLSMKSDNLGLVPSFLNLPHDLVPAISFGERLCAAITCSVRRTAFTTIFFNISFSIECIKLNVLKLNCVESQDYGAWALTER